MADVLHKGILLIRKMDAIVVAAVEGVADGAVDGAQCFDDAVQQLTGMVADLSRPSKSSCVRHVLASICRLHPLHAQLPPTRTA